MLKIHSLIIAAAVTAAGVSSAAVDAGPVHRVPSFSGTQMHGVHLSPFLGRFTVTPPRYPWTRPLSELRTPSRRARTAHVPVQPDSYPRKCTYLSDNASGQVTVYFDTTTNHNLYLTLPAAPVTSVYGWGVTTDYKVAYLGTYSDTIDVYAPCNPNLIYTLTGAPALGYPLGIATAKNLSHTTYANEFPAGVIDEWVGMAYMGSTADDPHCSASSYFLDSDRAGNVYLTCFDSSGLNEIVDFCDAPPFNPTTCTTIATIPNGFPGGIAVQTVNLNNTGRIVVADQYGNMHKYRCTGMNLATVPTCTEMSPPGWNWTLASPQPTLPALDYLALSMPKAAQHVTAANISTCTPGPTCGDGQDQVVAPWPPTSPAFDWNTLPILNTNSMPYGVADYPAVL